MLAGLLWGLLVLTLAVANKISPHEEDSDTPWIGEHADRLFVESKLGP